jgi:SAM-dependent methyltransferase
VTISDQDRSRVYEQPAWGAVADGTLRPGGLALTERALVLGRLGPGARVLDVGCGAGEAAALAARLGFVCVGIDRSAILLRRAREAHGRLALLRAAAERLPLADGAVDAALAECSLSVMPDRDRALDEIGRVLRPGGTLMVSDVYARNPDGLAALRRLPIGSCLSGALPEQQIRDVLWAHRFRIDVWEDHSEALRMLAARMTGACGGPAAFFEQAAGVDPFDLQIALARARPGYFLLVATKQAI